MKLNQITKKVLILSILSFSIIFSSLYGFSSADDSSIAFSNQTDVLMSSSTESLITQDDSVKQKKIHVLWQGYSFIENMTSFSSDIVIGEVIEQKETYVKGLPITPYFVKIEDVIKGDLTPGETITQLTIGDANTPPEFLIETKMMSVNEKYILFLDYYEKNEAYVSLGGPQGRFLIMNDGVYSLHNFEQKLFWLPFKVENQPVQDFTNQISNIIFEEMNDVTDN